MTPESSIPSDLQLQAQEIVREICGENEHALRWVFQVYNIAMTWDHIVDGDPIDTDMASTVFEALIYDWPLNPFFEQHKASLIPVMLNAVSRWKFSNLVDAPKWEAFAVFTDIPLTVGLLLHGPESYAKWNVALRSLYLQVMQEDDGKDGGKK